MKKLLLILLIYTVNTQAQSFEVGLMKYKGGGDWYANLETSLPNLIAFCNQELGTSITQKQQIIEPSSPDLFDLPFIHMTGHGNVLFTPEEREYLRAYLSSGGFIHIDDNYGMDAYIRDEMLKVFPELEWIKVPFTHPIYNTPYNFSTGLPKIHEHDNKAPEGLGLFYKGDLIVFYTYECDLGDGWEDQSIHSNPEEKRTKALQMGANILTYALVGGSNEQ